VELRAKIWCQLNKIKSLCLTKCLYDHELTNKAYLGDITAANIYKSFTHKMEAKTSWHRYGYEITSLSPYITLQITVTGCTHDCYFLHGENNKIYAKQERRLSQRNHDILCQIHENLVKLILVHVIVLTTEKVVRLRVITASRYRVLNAEV